MRVLLITKWKPNKGGVVTHVENLIKHSKNTFDIITYPPFISLPVFRALSFVLVGLLRGIGRDFDLIHAHYAVPQGLLGVFLKKIKRKPLVVTIHGSDMTILGSNPVMQHGVRFVLGNADAIIAVSRFLKEEAVKLGIQDKKVRVIYAGVAKGEKINDAPAGKRVVFVGSLVRQKGVDVLLRAFKKVSAKHGDAELLVAGDGEERRGLEKMSRELGVKMTLLGYENLKKVLAESAVLVLPSRAEGFGLVLLEAMSAGVPVVATNVGGIPEIIENEKNGLLVEKEDAAALAGAIVRVLEDEKLRNKLILEGRKTAEKFSWTRMADEIDSLYREISAS